MRRAFVRLVQNKLSLVTLSIGVLGLVAFWSTGVSTIQDLIIDILATYFLAWGLVALLSKLPREQVRERFVLMTVSLAACLVMVEAPVWLGIVDYRQVFSTYPSTSLGWKWPGFITHNELLWSHPPYHRSRGDYERGNIGEALCFQTDQDYHLNVKYDGNGFRNETDLETTDIVVIGDSYVESPMLPTQALMTSVLSDLHGSTVANLGISGYGPQQELVVLERYALKLRPKTIVWVFYEGNDLADAREYDEKLRAFANSGFLELRLKSSFVRNASAAVLRMIQGRGMQECTPHQDLQKMYGTVRNQGGQSRVYFMDHASGLPLQETESLSKTRSALEAAYQLCREHGIRLVVAFAPEAYRVYQGLPNLFKVSDEVKRWEVNDLPERFRSIVAEVSADIDYVDLSPFLKAEAERGIPVFLPDDSHWTPEGHQVVAKALETRSVDRPFYVMKQDGVPSKDDPKEDLALMVRAPDGTIRYWNKAAEELYGWAPNEALGKTSHRLLKTIFPKPLPSIEAELSKTGRWDGELVHKRRDGSQVIVASRWEVQHNANDRSTVVEINSERQRDI